MGNEDAADMAELSEEKCICFPYEHAPALKQELMNIFSAEIFVDCSPQSGYGVRAALLENVRAVAVCRNKTHKEFILKNVCLGFEILNLNQPVKTSTEQIL